ncbi:activating transcription factor 7-interacting protein 1 [Nematostella vectensis]|uniref:activating transcription factor 7-interacting protein 1 n=1 Tax=Nematostella vectensis TaxID=45351 RepID=UPI002076F0E1|nr:activating transcription factor 7-interacting protein 1 [Nematostella vectensis]
MEASVQGNVLDSEVVPAKRRKIDEVNNYKEDSSDAREDSGNDEKTPTQLGPLKIKPIVLERLRRITSKTTGKGTAEQSTGNDAEKQKCENSAVISNGSTDDVTKSEDVSKSNDVITSSTGSSPAHSPKPEDLTMLSTPPKSRQPDDESINKTMALEKVSAKLLARFDAPSSTGSPVFAEISTSDGGLERSDSEMRENEAGDEKTSVEPRSDGVSTSSQDTAGLSESNGGRTTVPQPGTDSSRIETESRRAPLNFNSDEFKILLRQMIDEKFRQIESAYQSKDPEGELRRRLLRLEDENTELHEYAIKLEKAVKLLLHNQKSKADKASKHVQTEVLKSPRTVSVSQPPQHPASLPLHLAATSTESTTRLTSTTSSIPGHSVNPAPLPQQVPYTPPPQIRTTPSQLLTPPTQYQPTAVQVARPPPPQYPGQIRTGVALPNSGAPGSSVARPQNPGQMSTMVVVRPPQQNVVYVNSSQVQVQPQQNFQVQSAEGQPRFMVGSHAATIATGRPPVPAQQLAQHQQQPAGVLITSRPTAAAPQHHQPQPANQVTGIPAQQRLPQPTGNPVTGRPHQAVQQPLPQQLPPQYRPPAIVTAAVARPPQVQGPPTQQVVPGSSPPVRHQAEFLQTQTRLSMQTPDGTTQGPPSGAPVPQQKDPPPRPSVSIAVVSNGIVLSWNMQLAPNHARITRYQLYALQDLGPNGQQAQWKKIGVVNALPLPMACTLTQFMSGNKYHFAVRATDEFGRTGLFSEPCTVTLK